MAPDGRRSADGTSAQLTNQSRPDAIVRAGVQPAAVRSENLSVARSPVRSIQVRSTPRFETESWGCAELAPAGDSIDSGEKVKDGWRATAFAVAEMSSNPAKAGYHTVASAFRRTLGLGLRLIVSC